MPSVFFYISGHGFGHASRQVEIINAFGRAGGGRFDVVIRTSAPRWLLERTLRVPFTLVDDPVDTGVVQFDSLRLDEEATLVQADEFHRSLVDRAGPEAARMRDADARFVVVDAPPLGCAAAAAAGVPAVVCANFTWDWIYAGYPGAAALAPDLVARIQEAYRKAQAAWRLPMHGGFETFTRIVDVPMVARHATRGRDEVRRTLGLPLDRPLALSSFGGYGVRGLDHSTLDCLPDIGVVVTGIGVSTAHAPGLFLLDDREVYARGLRYEDLVGAVDAVVTKPGYGTVSECVANGTAMLYTSRGLFVEYEALVREMPRYLRCRFIPQEDLLGGRWRSALEALLAQAAAPERPPTDGADVIARMIVEAADAPR